LDFEFAVVFPLSSIIFRIFIVGFNAEAVLPRINSYFDISQIFACVGGFYGFQFNFAAVPRFDRYRAVYV